MVSNHSVDFSNYIKHIIASELPQFVEERNGRKCFLSMLKNEPEANCKRFYDAIYEIKNKEYEYQREMAELEAEAVQDRKDIDDTLRFLGLSGDIYE